MTEDDIFAVAVLEGDLWRTFKNFMAYSQYVRFHALLFKNGQTWDEINGFRGPLFDYTPDSLRIIQNHLAYDEC